MTCEPQDKTNEKGKRKSERHEALCEAEHRKTKKKKQTQKHNQQKRKRKRHRQTDTLREAAGKKSETPSNQSKTITSTRPGNQNTSPACRVGV
jgi:hypothetical protein